MIIRAGSPCFTVDKLYTHDTAEGALRIAPRIDFLKFQNLSYTILDPFGVHTPHTQSTKGRTSRQPSIRAQLWLPIWKADMFAMDLRQSPVEQVILNHLIVDRSHRQQTAKKNNQKTPRLRLKSFCSIYFLAPLCHSGFCPARTGSGLLLCESCQPPSRKRHPWPLHHAVLESEGQGHITLPTQKHLNISQNIPQTKAPICQPHTWSRIITGSPAEQKPSAQNWARSFFEVSNAVGSRREDSVHAENTQIGR